MPNLEHVMTTQLPDDSHLPLEQRVPRESVASPSQLRLAPGEEVRWWKPGASEALKLLGWRWIYFIPAMLLIALVLYMPWRPQWWQLIIAWWKLVVIAVALPLGIAVRAVKTAIRNRREPFCIHCGYDLTGLQDNHTCPECGQGYSFRVIDEYRRDPHWFIERYKSHGNIPQRDVPFPAGPVGSNSAVKRRRSRDGT
jgi:predicted RNA-binding Zn-ribbon protein involved in translation (DUF1610 family)